MGSSITVGRALDYQVTDGGVDDRGVDKYGIVYVEELVVLCIIDSHGCRVPSKSVAVNNARKRGSSRSSNPTMTEHERKDSVLPSCTRV